MPGADGENLRLSCPCSEAPEILLARMTCSGKNHIIAVHVGPPQPYSSSLRPPAGRGKTRFIFDSENAGLIFPVIRRTEPQGFSDAAPATISLHAGRSENSTRVRVARWTRLNRAPEPLNGGTTLSPKPLPRLAMEQNSSMEKNIQHQGFAGRHRPNYWSGPY